MGRLKKAPQPIVGVVVRECFLEMCPSTCLNFLSRSYPAPVVSTRHLA